MPGQDSSKLEAAGKEKLAIKYVGELSHWTHEYFLTSEDYKIPQSGTISSSPSSQTHGHRNDVIKENIMASTRDRLIKAWQRYKHGSDQVI